MKPGLHNAQDLAAGAMFAAIGVLGLYFGADYPIGRAVRMGPGFVPTGLSWIMIGLGALIALRGLVSNGETLSAWKLRPLLLILGAIVIFALLIERAGLVAATFGVVIVAGIATPEWRGRELVICAVILAAGSVWLFVNMLTLPMPVWPPFIGR